METMMEILRELHPEVDFEGETQLIDKGILDSFDIVTLVAEIDDRYGVRLSAGDLVPENFNSAAQLYSLVRRKMES